MNNLVKKAIILAWITIAYNIIEGLLSVAFGVSEGSISLAGFGLDSFIEVASGIVVLWRFAIELHKDIHESRREEIATKAIGALFIILAFILALISIYQLINHHHPITTIPGVIISLLSLAAMFFLFKAKKTVGTELNSKTVLKDADCTMACIKLSLVLFFGSLIFWIYPIFWWVDSVASILLAYFIAKEGLCTLRYKENSGCSCD